MQQFFDQVWVIVKAIVVNFNKPEVWQQHLNQPAVFWPALAALAVVIFAETGLLVGFFLPGDSLLVTVGLIAQLSNWNIWWLMVVLSAAAILGDTVGYWFGAKSGPAIFNRPNSRFFKRDHLLMAKDVFDRHGGKAVIIARFMPFARTFVPVVAGAAKMEYRTFLFYNVIGGIAWIVSMLLIGYTAHLWLNPLGQFLFGPQFRIEKHIDILALFIIFVSVAPMAVKGLIEWRKKRKAPPAASVAAGTPVGPAA